MNMSIARDLVRTARPKTTAERDSGEPPIEPEKYRTMLHERIGRTGYMFILPFFALYAVFGIYPLIYSIYLSFSTSVEGQRLLTGLDNYRLLLQDANFWQSMLNGVIIFFLYVPVMTLMALVLAVMLRSDRIKGYKVFRLIIFVPFITNMIAAGFTFQLFFSESGGLVNSALGWLGLPGIPWFSNAWAARIALAILVTWAWLGYNMVIMLAGLETIPRDYFDAAIVDGASPRQVFWRITVPLMRPLITFSLVLSLLGSFNLFAELVALFSSTGGAGPLRSTATPMLEIFGQAFSNLRFGYASAQSYVYFMLIFGLTIFQIRRFGKGWQTE